MTRIVPSWMREIENELERELLRDPFVSGAFHAARSFGLPEREFWLTLVRALSAERERLVAVAVEKVTLMPMRFEFPAMHVHDEVQIEIPAGRAGEAADELAATMRRQAINFFEQAASVERAQAEGKIPSPCPHGYERRLCELCNAGGSR